jgi:hypothetical protein
MHVPQDNEHLPESSPDVPEAAAIRVADLRTAIQFIHALESASLDDENLDAEVLHQLRHPPQEPIDSIDPDRRLSIDLFLSATNASQENYTRSRNAVLQRHPDDEIL